MSKFLAPIHSWLFNKIQVSESLEAHLIESLKLQDSPFLADLYKTVGAPLPDSPLEDLIDQGNIHGWLQNRIHMTESRLASLVTWQVNENPGVMPQLNEIWAQAGAELAGTLEVSSAMTAEEMYKLVQDVILEGMPCDRVSQVTAANAKSVEWITTSCLHQGYFHATGGDVAHYYTLRESFVNGLIGAIRPGSLFTVKALPAGSGAAYHNQLTIQ